MAIDTIVVEQGDRTLPKKPRLDRPLIADSYG